jgi:hypothetical protein
MKIIARAISQHPRVIYLNVENQVILMLFYADFMLKFSRKMSQIRTTNQQAQPINHQKR